MMMITHSRTVLYLVILVILGGIKKGSMINLISYLKVTPLTSFPNQEKQRQKPVPMLRYVCYQTQKAQLGALGETETILRPFVAHMEAQKYFFLP